LTAVDRRAAGRDVTRIGIRAGVRHLLVPDVVQMAWQLTAYDTAYQNAQTVLTMAPMRASCGACGQAFETDDTLAICPCCAEMGARLEGGDEFVLEWVEYAGVGVDKAGEALSAPGHDHGLDTNPFEHFDHYEHGSR
jgi:Zn finger protein HypA/HybF involved in hydrogenase expression